MEICVSVFPVRLTIRSVVEFVVNQEEIFEGMPEKVDLTLFFIDDLPKDERYITISVKIQIGHCYIIPFYTSNNVKLMNMN